VLGIASQNDRVFYVVMENMPGLYLATVLDLALLLGRALSPFLSAYVAAMVADALGYVHGRSDREGQPLHIIHRAVGPMSVRVSFDGRVKLTNFGTAYSELRDRLLTPPGLLRGDAAYTAPELWRAVMTSPGTQLDPLIEGVIDGRADVFSLGLVLLEMLLGEYPLDPTDAPPSLGRPGLASEIRTERQTWIAPNVLADRVLRFGASEIEQRSKMLPKGLRDVVYSALEPDPKARCGAAEMRDGLLGYLRGLERPYGAEEAGKEVKDIHNGAKLAQRLLASPTERTALSLGEDDSP
jgi:serine/threonine-protein kinase